MPIKLLVDTSVWLDLAKDHRQEPVLAALQELVRREDVELVIPQVVLDEFRRNRARIIEESRRSLQAHFRIVREAVSRFAEGETRGKTLDALGEVDRKILIKGQPVNELIRIVEELLRTATPLPITDGIKQRVTDRALDNKAPYHRSKNSVGDAIIIETYAELVINLKEGERAAFVTHNIKDFSEVNGDHRKPHADFSDLFSAPQSAYFISLADAVQSVDPELIDFHDFEINNAEMQPRSLAEISEAEYLLFNQVWYNRHMNLEFEIEEGKHHVVPEKEYSRNPYRNDQTLDTVWQQALAAAKRVEDEIGKDKLGPWTDFEWGMINGKLSALRWVLGDEWDMLDT